MNDPRVIDTSVASMMYDESPYLAPYEPLLKEATLIISFQTVAEMRFGALLKNWGVRRQQRLERFFAGFFVVIYSDELATLWAQIMVEARRAGRRLEAGDGWIAATAKYLNAPLLTHDKDFDIEACPSITIYRFSADSQTPGS